MKLDVQVQTAPSASAASTNPDDRATAFQAGTAIPEAHSGTQLLVEAYVFIWIIIMVYVMILWLRQRGIARRLDTLERAIDKADAAKK